MAFFFIQMSDPQFGMFAAFSGLDDAAIEGFRRRGLNVKRAPRTTSFAEETVLYEKAVAAANRLGPDFVITTGDLVNDPGDPNLLAELERITGQLDESIPRYWAAGNADVGNAPTPGSLGQYRERFGDDNYLFDHRGSRFVVLNSCVACDPTNVPGEWDKQQEFLRDALKEGRAKSSTHIIVFTHHPLFLKHPEEEDTHFAIPAERRRVLLELFKAHGVSAVFSGHWHRNRYVSDGALQVVTSGSVGYPLGDDPSGIRIVKVYDDRIEHEYYGLDALPEVVELEGS